MPAENNQSDAKRYPPIGDYALLSDCHSAALVSSDGSVDWCCFHRFDARPVFARLLDWDRGGCFRIAPADEYRVSRTYREGTNILETRFETDDGVLLLIDALALDERDPHPPHRLLRIVRCEAGEVRVRMQFLPRFDFGLTVPRLETHGPHTAVVYGGADGLILSSDLPIQKEDICHATSEARLREGDERYAAVAYSLPHELEPKTIEKNDVVAALEETERFWKAWSAKCKYDGPYRDQVLRSAVALKAMTNSPTGAIIAAPTTSLPEEIGGERNWDYRYVWMRDAAMNLSALFSLGYREEAHAFMHWVERTTAGRSQDVQILYGVGGERMLPEVKLDKLDGYRGSRPVRIGNAAVEQFQLDVYGFVLDAAWLFHRGGGEISPQFWSFLAGLVDAVRDRWELPDDGIWEVRGPPRHFVSSKLFAWVAVDRAIRLAKNLTFEADIDSWRKLRSEIRQAIETKGVDPATGAFVQAFGEQAMDASALLIPLTGFLPADDPRVLATMEHVETELAPEGLVYRYIDSDDGLSGEEGTFVICSFWLVDNLALAGKVERARELFDRLVGYANDVGLLAEEVDGRTGEQLGNFPQAFSHVGLIRAAMTLDRAEQAAKRRARG